MGHAIQYDHIRKKLKVEDKIRFIPLKEAGVYSQTYFACSKKTQGKRAIAAVNKVLLKSRKSIEYRSFTEQWLDPNTIDLYRRDYDQQLLLRKGIQ